MSATPPARVDPCGVVVAQSPGDAHRGRLDVQEVPAAERPPVHLGGRHDDRPGLVDARPRLRVARQPQVRHLLGAHAVLEAGVGVAVDEDLVVLLLPLDHNLK